MDWQIPLLGAVAVFLAFMLWKARPAQTRTRGQRAEHRQRMTELESKALAASSPDERAALLSDAAEECAQAGDVRRASAMFQKAIEANTGSVETVRRAVLVLAPFPNALSNVLWRLLALAPWSGPSREAVALSLDELAKLYAGSLGNETRSQALMHARHLLGPG